MRLIIFDDFVLTYYPHANQLKYAENCLIVWPQYLLLKHPFTMQSYSSSPHKTCQVFLCVFSFFLFSNFLLLPILPFSCPMISCTSYCVERKYDRNPFHKDFKKNFSILFILHLTSSLVLSPQRYRWLSIPKQSHLEEPNIPFYYSSSPCGEMIVIP